MRTQNLLAALLVTALACGVVVPPASADVQIISVFSGSLAPGEALAGYVNETSVVPGQLVSLKVRSSNQYVAKVVRIGSGLLKV